MFALFLFSGLPYPPPSSLPIPHVFSPAPLPPALLPAPFLPWFITPALCHATLRSPTTQSWLSTRPLPTVISCSGHEPTSQIAKGRTNVELREQFILAEGVSQSMTPFKSKPSPNSSVSSQSGTTAQQRSQSLPNSGPIIKVCSTEKSLYTLTGVDKVSFLRSDKAKSKSSKVSHSGSSNSCLPQSPLGAVPQLLCSSHTICGAHCLYIEPLFLILESNFFEPHLVKKKILVKNPSFYFFFFYFNFYKKNLIVKKLNLLHR